MSAPQARVLTPIIVDRAVRSLTGVSAFALLLLVVMTNFALQPLTEPDFGWHLRTGLDVLDKGMLLPSLDPYSHTMPDWAWVEHAWLTDVVIAIVYLVFGALGVIMLFAVLTVSAWLLGAGVASAGLMFRWLACTVSLWVAMPYLGARTQLVTLLGVAVLLSIVKRTQDGQASARWWIPPLFLLWANLHGGFIAGLLLLGLVIATSVIVKWLSERQILFTRLSDEPLLSWLDLKQLAVLTVVSACLSFVNPYGWRLHVEIFDSLSNAFMLDTLQEWQPLSMSGLAGRRYVFYLAGLGLAMALWYRRVEPVRWVVGAVFLGFSFRHMRNIPFFLIVSLPLCAEALSEGYKDLCRRWRCSERAASLAAAGLTAVTLLWLGPDHVQRVAQSGTRPSEFFKGTSYPIEAVEWIRTHGDQAGQRLYNDYADGGFLLWWLPGTKVFIDGRMPAWQSRERSILRDYMELIGQNPDLSVLVKYSVDWALVRKQTSLEKVLARDEAWSRLYDDDKAAIYRLKATTTAS
jgi:hypothetical protein